MKEVSHIRQRNLVNQLLTNLKEHQSNRNSASRKRISTLVLLKSLGHDGIFQSGLTSSCNSFNSCENGIVLPNLTTTLKQKETTFRSVLFIVRTTTKDYMNYIITTRYKISYIDVHIESNQNSPASELSLYRYIVLRTNFDSQTIRRIISRYSLYTVCLFASFPSRILLSSTRGTFTRSMH